MDAISQVDRLATLLQARLAARERGRKPAGGARTETKRAPDALSALAALENVDERQIRRAFVQHLLVDQFGRELLNDASFQQIVTRVTDEIASDQTSSRLLDRLLSEMRGGR